MRRLSLPATIVLYLDLWYLLRLASLCAPRSMRMMAMLCRQELSGDDGDGPANQGFRHDLIWRRR
ncbi:hypothetical protein Hanom_Chr07g00662231 [Helianthus anomalus]